MQLSALARGILIALGLVWVLVEVRQSRVVRADASRADRGSREVVVLAIGAGLVAAVAVARWVPSAALPPSAVVGWIGCGLVAFGIVLRIWSIRTLGRYFTFTVQTSGDQPVITAGPYRVVRHPGYTGLLLLSVGIGLLLANWLAVVVVTAAATGGLSYRIRIEERELLRDLGPAYREYAATRKRLIPFIW
ncbi:isoprenylcysteine carboxylmethyltransferase family protein [Catellatospora sp. NPDC049609]|uniref:methyltransferase family protein n=1 Tax=Catellatospora sp. NPDC049609 TaxID=3155505 RepID=UPI00344AB109